MTSLTWTSNNEFKKGPGGYYTKIKPMLAHNLYETSGKRKGKMTNMPRGYKGDPPIKGWLASEKLDGIRCIWTGEHLLTRQGKKFNFVPEWFLGKLPKGLPLDGELWCGRGIKNYQYIAGISSWGGITFLNKLEEAQKKPDSKKSKKVLEKYKELDKKWKNVTFQVFDSPVSDIPYEERIKLVKSKLKNPLKLVKFFKIKSEEQLQEYYDNIITLEGEGVMIRAPGSPYEEKRSRLLLKMKPIEDSEGQIMEYKEGEGKYKGLLGSFICQMIEKGKPVFLESGEPKTFCISGMDDSVRKNYKSTHPIGTLITYTYSQLTGDGYPRFPRYKGIRHDMVVKKRKREEFLYDENLGDYPINKIIKDEFEELIKKVSSTRENGYTFKIANYRKAIRGIVSYDKPVKDKETALEAMKEVGMKNPTRIIEKIEEIIQFGSLKVTKVSKVDPKVQAIQELKRIPGIGNAVASRLYDEGFKSIADIIERGEDRFKKCAKYIDDIEQRIPRVEMVKWRRVLKNCLPNGIEGECMGSYRREKETSGDIDFLIVSKKNDGCIKKILNKIKDKIKILKTLSNGEHKFMGIVRFREGGTARRLDIFWEPLECLPFAQLHHTGSGEFNVKLRKIANEKGYRISQKGLYNLKKKVYLRNSRFKTEEDILKFLGQEYISPKDR